ncbi:dentin sialophosphoprotein [Diaphorina citri]|uniref:Dentin sialophosphoprotein n=1 Tax=Diaphorina citri TaxID=121845 RepID=A0A1S4ER04_DIACI|nr:dentin sialophosphoprotein [Diaphorina citri]
MMNKASFLKNNCNLIPMKSKKKTSSNSERVGGYMTRSTFYSSKLKPKTLRKSSSLMSAMESAKSTNSCSDIQDVEVDLCQLFEGNKSDLDNEKNPTPRKNVQDNNDDDSIDNLLKVLHDLESSDEESENQQSKNKSNWGDTYPINTPFKTKAKLHISSSRSNQSPDLSTSEEKNTCPERNTQMVWEDILTQAKDIVEEQNSEEIVSPRESKDFIKSEACSMVCLSETPALGLSDEEKEKLLQFLCYRSFELIDFNDDSVWQQISLKMEFNQGSCQFYKNYFLNNLVKTSHNYHLPHYFSKHLKEKYGETSFLAIESGERNPDSSNIGDDSSVLSQSMLNKRKHSQSNSSPCPKKASLSQRRNTVQDMTSSDEDEIVGIPLKKGKHLGSNKLNGTKRNTHPDPNRTDGHSSCNEIVSSSSQSNNHEDSPCTNKTNRTSKTKASQRNSLGKGTKKNTIAEEESNEGSDDSKGFNPFITPKFSAQKKERVSPNSSTSKTTHNKSDTSDTNTSDSSEDVITPTPSTPKSRSRMRVPYLHYEKVKMLNYLKTKKLDSIKGNVFWKLMEADNVLPERTWQSLKNHFFRSLVHELRMYNLEPSFEKKLKQCSGKM